MSSKQALAMWGAQQLTRMGKPIPDSTKRTCGNGLREAVASGQRRTMTPDRIAVNHRTALKMFWDAGFDTEQALLRANAALETVAQPSPGYYYDDAVSLKITELKGV